MFDTLRQDCLYGARRLLKNPAFTLITVISLALGIGANTAIFSLINAVLLRPLPVKDAETLTRIYPGSETTSYPNYIQYRDHNQVFSDLAAYSPTILGVNSNNGINERTSGEFVTGNYFSMLGVNAALGRTFFPEETQTPGTHPVVVVSHGLWQRRFGGDPSVIGKTLSLNGVVFNIIGVAPQNFTGTRLGFSPDVWIPIMMQGQVTHSPDRLNDRKGRGFNLIGRLKPGVSIEQAQAGINILYREVDKELLETKSTWGFAIVEPAGKLHRSMQTPALLFLGLLAAVVGMVLLISCANAANLFLASASVRRKEIAVRLALGASRGRLIRQLLTESMLLSLLAGCIGLLLAMLPMTILERLKSSAPFPVAFNFSLDVRVLLFTLGVSLVTGLAFGLVPALLSSKPELVPALKDEVTSGARRYQGGRLRKLLVIAQVATSLVLLICAGLFVRSLQNAQAVEVGFDTENSLIMPLDLGFQGYSEAQSRDFTERLLERLEKYPGVASVTIARVVPLGGMRMSLPLSIPKNDGTSESTERPIEYNTVGAKYFETTGIPIIAGRGINEGDVKGAPGVVVINETMARQFWPGQDPIGKRLSQYNIVENRSNQPLEVVGVAKNSKYNTLGEDPEPFMYLSFAQNFESSMNFQIRTTGDPRALVNSVRGIAQSMDGTLPVEVKTVTEHMGVSLLMARVGATIIGLFGVLGLVLAAIGIYGIISYTVSQRTQEIGIRMALGARRSDIFRLVIGQGMILVAAGLCIGLLLAVASTRVLSSMLYGVSATDPLTFALITLLLVTVGLVACFIPSRKAVKVDPLVALRYE